MQPAKKQGPTGVVGVGGTAQKQFGGMSRRNHCVGGLQANGGGIP
jgi:hypothetical protein